MKKGPPGATSKDIISEATFAGRSWIYANLNLLTEKGFLIKERRIDENTLRKVDIYNVKEKEELRLPYFGDL